MELTDLVSVRTLERIQDNFSVATGIACVIRNTKGNTLTKMSKPSKLWQAIIQHPEVSKISSQRLFQAFEKVHKSGQIEIFERYLDCHAFLVPIYVSGRVIAFAIGGLTRFGNPNLELCAAEAEKLNIDLDSFLDMYLALPIITPPKLEACANLFKVVATTISNLAKEGSDAKELNQILEQEIMKSTIELQESEELYTKLFNTINDGVYVANDEGIITAMNKTGAHMIGYKPEELIGKKLRSLYVNPADRNKFLEKIDRNGSIEDFFAIIKHKDGHPVYFRTNATAIKSPDNQIIGVQGIFRKTQPRQHNKLHAKSPNTTVKDTSHHQESSE